MLRLSSAIWKRHCPWALPDPGADLAVHEDLPLLRVVSVMEANATNPAAALLRIPSLALAHAEADVMRWELVLSQQGWRRLPQV